MCDCKHLKRPKTPYVIEDGKPRYIVICSKYNAIPEISIKVPTSLDIKELDIMPYEFCTLDRNFCNK